VRWAPHPRRQVGAAGLIVALTTLREPSLSAACQAGLVSTLNDGMAWGLLPLYHAAAELQGVSPCPSRAQ